MISAMRASVSGLRASSRSLGVSASNIVNAGDSLHAQNGTVLASASGGRSGGQEDAPLDYFRPQKVQNVTAPEGGVAALAQEIDPPYVFSFAPGDPNADENGQVLTPNVDFVGELVRLMQAETLYQANMKAMKAESEMLGGKVNNRV